MLGGEGVDNYYNHVNKATKWQLIYMAKYLLSTCYFNNNMVKLLKYHIHITRLKALWMAARIPCFYFSQI